MFIGPLSWPNGERQHPRKAGGGPFSLDRSFPDSLERPAPNPMITPAR
jgi:hypothetical protein